MVPSMNEPPENEQPQGFSTNIGPAQDWEARETVEALAREGRNWAGGDR